MKEMIFVIAKAEEGGYYARAVGASIFTQAETLSELQLMIKDAIACHYDETIEAPQSFGIVFWKA